MKITRRQLRRIIKEEKAKILKEQYRGRGGREEAVALLEEYRDQGIPDSMILEYIIFNHLNSDMAYEVMSGFQDEL
ncbi:MAG: hypothetical protein CBC29_06515 [Methylococcaceae bacterium TMED69]|nr:MAG: hypothetical protein CBC29_06515 [Methylococcaceae bacterium TMED69]|tara:strand:+ start:1634 stop:1861 length:228 start_codon:yes stop_codon:yes gene_type:complete